MSNQHTQDGFTLIELLIVLGIVAILGSLALPKFSDQVAQNQSIAQAEDIVTAVALARAEAIKRAGRVSICASADGVACGDDWTAGYMIFFDYAVRDDAASPSLDDSSGESRIVRYSGKQKDASQISVTRNSTNVAFFRFTSMGTLANIDAYPVIINSKIQPCTENSARKITISASGMVKVESVGC